MPLSCWLSLVLVVLAQAIRVPVVQVAQAAHRVPVVLLAVGQLMAQVQQVVVFPMARVV
jgi:hypothetical protein